MGHLRRSARVARIARGVGNVIAVGAVQAGAASAQASQTYVLTDLSTFQRGCFAPCECAIGEERPLAGTFSLAFRSDNGLFADYDMNDVRWRVEGSAYATPPDAPITGTGTYSVGGEFAVEQRMTADLQIADEAPAFFDSGTVPGGGGFPDRIDIEISENGKTCFDTVMHVVAQPVPEPATTLQLLTGVGGLLGIAGSQRPWRLVANASRASGRGRGTRFGVASIEQRFRPRRGLGTGT